MIRMGCYQRYLVDDDDKLCTTLYTMAMFATCCIMNRERSVVSGCTALPFPLVMCH